MTAQFQVPTPTPCRVHDYRLRNVPVASSSLTTSLAWSCLWQTTKRIGPSATFPGHHCTDNDRVIALNPSIKRGHHDIVAPQLLPVATVAKNQKPKTKNPKLVATVVDNINNIQICQLQPRSSPAEHIAASNTISQHNQSLD